MTLFATNLDLLPDLTFHKMPRLPSTMSADLAVRQRRRESETTHDDAVNDTVRTKNRRKRYLDLHPEYFGPQLELAGVQLCIRANI